MKSVSTYIANEYCATPVVKAAQGLPSTKQPKKS